MLQENQQFANRYRLVKRLGQGAFSEVWKAEDTETGNLTVALKVYAPEKGLDEDGAKIFSEEFAIVFDVHHSNLLTPTYYAKENNSPYLVLPFCEQGNATRLIGKADERQVAQFLHDVSSALAYLHAKDIIHQDIKPDNVLIDDEGNFLVTDFGISTRIRSTLRKTVGDKKSAGTRAYMGPERFSKNPDPIKASDIWSFGATLFELMKGDVPFGEDGGLVQKMGAETPDVPGAYSPELKQLVERCLAKETWNRPTAIQLRDISEKYLRTGVWNLSLLNGDNPKKPELPKQDEKPSSRKTERKVVTVLEASTSDGTSQKSVVKNKQRKILLWTIGGIAFVSVIVILLLTLPWKHNYSEDPVEPFVEEVDEEVVEEVIPEQDTEWSQPQEEELQETPVISTQEEIALIEKYYFAKKYSECLPLARKYAEQGYAEAQYYLANMYRRGYAVQKDTAEALKWYHKAAAQSHPIAQCTIGYFYTHGYGVPQNDYEAIKWYKKSGEQGYVIAQRDLGICYEWGDGVEIDLYKAKEWYSKAAAQGDKVSKEALDRVQQKINNTW